MQIPPARIIECDLFLIKLPFKSIKTEIWGREHGQVRCPTANADLVQGQKSSQNNPHGKRLCCSFPLCVSGSLYCSFRVTARLEAVKSSGPRCRAEHGVPSAASPAQTRGGVFKRPPRGCVVWAAPREACQTCRSPCVNLATQTTFKWNRPLN